MYWYINDPSNKRMLDAQKRMRFRGRERLPCKTCIANITDKEYFKGIIENCQES